MKRNWPTREEWAKQHRTFLGFVSVSVELSDYASASEIATAIAELEQRWRELGKELRRVNREVDVSCDPHSLRRWRQQIRQAIKTINTDGPHYNQWLAVTEHSPMLAEINRRRKAALAAAEDECRREVESRPIDDAAWAEELARRKEADEYAEKVGDGVSFVHHV